jgi:hypothetical protein
MIRVPAPARALASANALAITGLLALVVWAWQLTVMRDDLEVGWVAVTFAVVAAGFVALGWLRSTRVGMTAPQIMLLLGACGMVAGLACDAQAGGFAALASVCLQRQGDFPATLRLHWQQLPDMHLGMITGGLLTVPLLRAFRKGCRRQFCARLVQNLACSAWMVLGMTAGTLVFTRLAAWAGGRGAAAMLGGMFGGMVWGMVASVSVYRLWFLIIDGYRAHRAAREVGYGQH